MNREAFVCTLNSVAPGLSTRKVIEQSDCFVFKNGRVMTFNDEVFCKAKSGLPKEVSGAVPAKPLLNQLSKWTEDEIEVELADGFLSLRGKGRGCRLNAEAEIVLPVDQIEKPTTFQPLPKDFAEAVAVVGGCASTDASQYPLDCVHLTAKWLEACTRFQVCRWRIKTGLESPLLVRPASIKPIRDLGMTEWCGSSAWLHFRNADGVQLSCRSYAPDDFRDLGAFLKMESGVQVTLPKGLVQAVEKAQEFSKELGPDQNFVTIDLRPGKLKLTSSGASGEYWERKKVTYAGAPMSFLISPEILSDVVQKHAECQLAEDKLKVNGGAYDFVTWLGRPESKEQDVESEQA